MGLKHVVRRGVGEKCARNKSKWERKHLLIGKSSAGLDGKMVEHQKGRKVAQVRRANGAADGGANALGRFGGEEDLANGAGHGSRHGGGRRVVLSSGDGLLGLYLVVGGKEAAEERAGAVLGCRQQVVGWRCNGGKELKVVALLLVE